MLTPKQRKIALKIQQSLEVLNTLEAEEKKIKLLEKKLAKELSRLFSNLEKDLIKLLKNNDLFTIKLNKQHETIIDNYSLKYVELLMKYNTLAYESGVNYTSQIASLISKKSTWFGSLKDLISFDTLDLFGRADDVSYHLRTQTIQGSQNTMKRINSSINEIIGDGYGEGLGTNEVANNIKNKFNGLKTWEAQRISRTEVNSAQSMGAYAAYEKNDIEYHEWLAAGDERTRTSHAELNGEIVKVGTAFSNGLMYPGDKSGPLTEWINCRCTTIPFIMPWGYTNLGLNRFRESDLIRIWNDEDPPKFNTGDTKLDEELGKQLPGYENKIKLEADTTEIINSASPGNDVQNFKVFKYSANGDFTNSESVKILVSANNLEKNMVSDLKYGIKNYDKLAPSYRLALNKIIIPKGYNGRVYGYYRHRTDYITVFSELTQNDEIFSHTFIHEATHLMDGKGLDTISKGKFKKVFLKYAKEELPEGLYNKFEIITGSRSGFDSLSQLEQEKIKNVFSSDYGYDSWRKYVKRDSTFSGSAFSEELADSVGTTITGKIEDREVNDKVVEYILNELWK